MSISANNNSTAYTEDRKGSAQLSWWNVIIGIDIFLVVASVIKVYFPDSSSIQWFGRPFNLAVEMNLAVWWSGLCIAALGLLCYELFCTTPKEEKSAWLAMSILLMGLSLDEVGSLHERSGGWFNLLPYAIICLTLFSYFFIKLINIPGKRKSALLITTAFALYASVVLQEYLEHLIQWPSWMKGLRLGIEEGTELFATLLIFFAVVKQRDFSDNSIGAVLPKPGKMKSLSVIFAIGIILEVVTYFSFPSLREFTRRGNPLVWYPMVLFLLLFCTVYWNKKSQENASIEWNILALLFVLSSAAMMWNLLYFVPAIKNLVPGKAFGFLLYLLPLMLLIKIYFKSSVVKHIRDYLPLGLSVAVLVACLGYFAVYRGFNLATWSLFSTLFGVFMMFSLNKLVVKSG